MNNYSMAVWYLIGVGTTCIIGLAIAYRAIALVEQIEGVL